MAATATAAIDRRRCLDRVGRGILRSGRLTRVSRGCGRTGWESALQAEDGSYRDRCQPSPGQLRRSATARQTAAIVVVAVRTRFQATQRDSSNRWRTQYRERALTP
jgi:hypothetical protein